jgi:hypothetical protein
MYPLTSASKSYLATGRKNSYIGRNKVPLERDEDSDFYYATALIPGFLSAIRPRIKIPLLFKYTGSIQRVIYNDTTYFLLLTSGNLSAKVDVPVGIFALGGGGGGGQNQSGGGGGGGLQTNISGVATTFSSLQEIKRTVTITAQTTYTVTVGVKGNGGKKNVQTATVGGNSSITGPDITTITAYGGGTVNANGPAQPGGCGSGGSGYFGHPGGIGSQGGNGGDGSNTNWAGAGGGGPGSIGQDGNPGGNNYGGRGGEGITFMGTVFGGGGGGSTYFTSLPGQGGGVGGRGSGHNEDAISATGYGGGGGGSQTDTGPDGFGGGNGSPGIVILTPLYPSAIIFSYTGTTVDWTVPANLKIAAIDVILWGAGGSGGNQPGNGYITKGGAGACVKGCLTVTAGETLTILVGQGAGHNGSSLQFGGGGSGTRSDCGSGGGRSTIRRAGNDVVTASGGGGSAYTDGANANGAPGVGVGSSTAATNGRGGNANQTQGGDGGGNPGYGPGVAGTQYTGANSPGTSYGGGGGGGYFGGGSGGSGNNNGGGGGGGSCLISNLVYSTVYAAAYGTGGSTCNTPQNITDKYYSAGIGEGGTHTVNGGDGKIVIVYYT